MLASTVAALISVAGTPTPMDDGQSFNLADAVRCSHQLKTKDPNLIGAARRECLIAIAATYIQLEENRLDPEKMLLADDISRHQLGTTPEFRPGNRAKVIADRGHEVIGAIRNRKWTVDGDTVWIVYDGYLKSRPSAPSFHVAERFTITDGLIREIMIAGAKAPGAKPGECIE